MSTRYVWDKCNINNTEILNDSHVSSYLPPDEGGIEYMMIQDAYGNHIKFNGDYDYTLYYTSFTNDSDIINILKNGITLNNSVIYRSIIHFYANTYYVFSSSKNITFSENDYVFIYHSDTNGMAIIEQSIFSNLEFIYESTYNFSLTLYKYNVTTTQTAGSVIEKLSSSSKSSYPTNGISGSYWYIYKGSDNIDPTAVGYSTTSPKGGSTISIKVIARSNTYGGTIKYQYQVQLNSGSWTTLTTTTSTSYSYTIPKGTNTFRARVRASDNYGFTSSTYVTGSTLTVINNTAPTISGSNSDLGSFSYLPPYIEYTINDADGNIVSVSIKLDSQSIYSGTAVLGKTRFIVFPDWDSLSSGSHTITITANDGQGGVTTRTYTFSKSVNANLISRERWRRLNEGNVYDVIYFETAADVVTTNNGKYLRDRINAIRSRVAALKGTSATALAAMDSSIITERLHMKTDSGYNVKYLDTKSQYVKIGSQTVEDVLTQIESDIAALKG